MLKSGSELRLPAPPNAQATTRESEEIRALAGRRDAAALERIRYWDFWSPAHRWNEILSDTAVAQNFGIGGGNGIRAFAMLLEMNRPAEALQAFETSEKHDPNRFRGLYGAGKAAALMGDQAKARSYYGKLLVLVQKADSERPELKEAKAFLAKK